MRCRPQAGFATVQRDFSTNVSFELGQQVVSQARPSRGVKLCMRDAAESVIKSRDAAPKREREGGGEGEGEGGASHAWPGQEGLDASTLLSCRCALQASNVVTYVMIFDARQGEVKPLITPIVPQHWADVTE
jgi:hypothetical protein